uniref:Caspase n=1 Tax=Aceria tosichella TaxID=561515 RepID=A0A6G1SKB3_9ACAR
MDTGDFCNPIPHVPVLTTPRHSFDYNMCHKNRGICLILENENFSERHPSTRSLGRRTGSHVDVQRSLEVFSSLGFQLFHQKDLTRTNTLQLLKSLAAMDHRESDCFVCVVLTHGDHGELYAHDGKYSIDLLFRYFLADNCPTLCGKPKLFFIQACQGGMLDEGVLVRQTSRDSTDTVSYFKIPTYADFMIAYSTLPGFYSFRNTEKGSWFIRALCDVLEKYNLEFDLLTMMTMVSQRVAYDYTSQAATAEFSQKKQVPCLTSMLTRRVYLTPKSLQL